MLSTKVRVVFEIDVVGEMDVAEVNALLRPAGESFCAAVSPLGPARMEPIDLKPKDERR